MAVYVDGFVLPVPTRNVAAYRRMARTAGKVWREHGALEFRECVGDDLNPKMDPQMKVLTFPKMAKAKSGEPVVFSFIIWPDKQVRDAAWEKIMADPEMQPGAMEMPFDGKRMFWGGFKPLLNTLERVDA